MVRVPRSWPSASRLTVALTVSLGTPRPVWPRRPMLGPRRVARRRRREACRRRGRRARRRRHRPSGRRRARSGPRAPSFEVTKVHFRGNRKVEDDAIRVILRTKPGAIVNQESGARRRARHLEDGLLRGRPGREPPRSRGRRSPSSSCSRRSRRSARSSSPAHDEIGLTKINEVLDLKKEQILDLAKVKKNVQKIKQLYVEKGFYMAEVTTS